MAYYYKANIDRYKYIVYIRIMELPVNTEVTFEEFYDKTYPRKGKRPTAERAWNKLSDVDKFNAIQGAAYHVQHDHQWKNPKYIPLPSTFLNNRMWEDAVVKDKTAKTRVEERANESVGDFVWSSMVGMFGDAWIKRHGEKPNDIWSKFLSRMPEKRIKRGLRRTLESGAEFPPSFPKFCEYCAPTFGEQNPPSLPKPPGNPDVALDALAKVQRIIKEAKNES